MKIIVCTAMLFLSLKAEGFITKTEYAKMLYVNPRGIGCVLCHGKRGEGSVIAKYKHKGEQKKLVAPAINNLSKEKFFRALKESNSVMPKYFLANSELDALYFYVTNQSSK
ncbi:MAG: cytochrome c [Sulfurospirillum sp.]|nr:cytochrome c [Sulfurospirillum sp.]MBL0703692.1 cytochrome c [Sulfurospirillum sp.]